MGIRVCQENLFSVCKVHPERIIPPWLNCVLQSKEASPWSPDSVILTQQFSFKQNDSGQDYDWHMGWLGRKNFPRFQSFLVLPSRGCAQVRSR